MIMAAGLTFSNIGRGQRSKVRSLGGVGAVRVLLIMNLRLS